MRISDWSSDVCSSDLLLRKFGCNTSETAYVCFVTSTSPDRDHWTDRPGQYNIPRAKRVAVNTTLHCQPGGGVHRLTQPISDKARPTRPTIFVNPQPSTPHAHLAHPLRTDTQSSPSH